VDDRALHRSNRWPVRLRSIRTEHLNDLYTALTATGGQHGDGLAAKTVHEVHLIVRSALTQTTEQGLTRTNVALRAQRPRPHAIHPPAADPRRPFVAHAPGQSNARSPRCYRRTDSPSSPRRSIDAGYLSRLLAGLADEMLIERQPRQPIEGVGWEAMIRQITRTYSLLDDNETPMATYQHLLPGMGAAAATNFAALLTTASGQCDPADSTKRRVVIGRRSTGAASQTPRSTTRGRAIR
jgi:hypothetical protein